MTSFHCAIYEYSVQNLTGTSILSQLGVRCIIEKENMHSIDFITNTSLPLYSKKILQILIFYNFPGYVEITRCNTVDVKYFNL